MFRRAIDAAARALQSCRSPSQGAAAANRIARMDRLVDRPEPACERDDVVALGDAARGARGVIVEVGCRPRHLPATAPKCAFDIELERCLLEMGFVEGAEIEVLHEGFIGRDPIAVRVDDMSVALRRREAQAVLIRIRET